MPRHHARKLHKADPDAIWAAADAARRARLAHGEDSTLYLAALAELRRAKRGESLCMYCNRSSGHTKRCRLSKHKASPQEVELQGLIDAQRARK